jgi:hypothetical protein
MESLSAVETWSSFAMHFVFKAFEMSIRPKIENANMGFHYIVTDEQIAAHRKKTKIFKW